MNGEDFSLLAISPIDGRYSSQTQNFQKYFSEYALFKYRLEAEVKYLLFFYNKILKKKLSASQEKNLLEIISNFNLEEARKIKEIEKVTHHDVKAVEYYLRPVVEKCLPSAASFIHFALTSEDTNSIAYSLSIKNALKNVMLPKLKALTNEVFELASSLKKTTMLARTHGQYAVPTTLGKELVVFAVRLKKEADLLENLKIEAKLSGAVGNFNAALFAFPKIDWIKETDAFIKTLGLSPNHFTTQILPGDSYAHIFQSLKLINSIIIGLNQDMWRYVSDNIFKLKVVENEVGSSTMPHKVNPIDFENSEGNLGVANAILGLMADKLVVSRLQRDLSDSTVKRNIGACFAYSFLGWNSTIHGLKKVDANKSTLNNELSCHWEVLTEALQTIFRKEGCADAYELVKKESRGKELNEKEFKRIVKLLKINEKTKNILNKLNPKEYVGLAEKLVDAALREK